MRAYMLLNYHRSQLHASHGQSNLAGVGGPAFSPSHVTVNGLLVPNEDIPSPVYDKEQHGKFRFWTSDDWAPYAQGGAKADFATSADGVPLYLENEDGNTFAPDTHMELRKLVKQILATVFFHHLNPVSWGKAGTHVTRYVLSEIYKVFPVLAKCRGHFRVHTLLTRMYPDYKKLRKHNPMPTIKNEESEFAPNMDNGVPGPSSSKRDGREHDTPPRPRKRVKPSSKCIAYLLYRVD